MADPELCKAERGSARAGSQRGAEQEPGGFPLQLPLHGLATRGMEPGLPDPGGHCVAQGEKNKRT